MSEVVLLDGEVLAPRDARISIFDHGFLFGDSVYEVVRTRGGELFLFDEHAARLERSAAQIYLDLHVGRDELRAEIERAVEIAGNEESYARIIVTRGVGELELHPVSCEKPTLAVIVRPLALPPERMYREGIRLAIVGRRRVDPLYLSPTAKTGNYLNNVLAIIEARRRGFDDAVMLNARGNLTEGTTANLFFVENGTIRTPEIASGILEGITRGFAIRLLREEGLEVEEGNYPPERLHSAEEAFITSTTRDVMPVGVVDESALTDGAPGPVTRLLMDRFAAL